MKRKKKRMWVREIFKKRIEQGVYHNFLELKKNVRPFKVWLDPLLFVKLLLKTAQSLSLQFPSGLSLSLSLSLFVSFIFFFMKAKILLEIPQPRVQHLVYVFPFSFIFINALLTSQAST